MSNNIFYDPYNEIRCDRFALEKLVKESEAKAQRIAELEEQLANAIVPKFKVGQEVYVICDPNRIVSGWKIADYEYYKQQYIIENKDGIDWIHKDRIFATKKEALEKLKELGEKK